MASIFQQIADLNNLRAQLQRELPEMARQANGPQARQWLEQFKKDHPDFAGLIQSTLQGTPQEVLASLKAFVGVDLSGIAGVENFIAVLQGRVKEEVLKPRKALGTKREHCWKSGGTCRSSKPVNLAGKLKHFCEVCGHDMTV